MSRGCGSFGSGVVMGGTLPHRAAVRRAGRNGAPSNRIARGQPGHRGAVTSYSSGPVRRPVPVRTILATIGLVLATALALYIVVEVRRVLTWIVIGAFFAVALYPVAGWVQRRLLGGRRRALATFLVFLVVFIFLGALVTAFAVPLVNEGTKFAGQLPGLIDDARSGRGPIGDLLE